MCKEPAFMRDIHKKQEKEYKKTRNLSLREFVKYINERAETALEAWGLEEKVNASKITSKITRTILVK